VKGAYRKVASGVFKLNDDWDEPITPEELVPITRASHGESALMGMEVYALAFDDGGIVWIEDPGCEPAEMNRSGAYVIGEWALDQIANVIEDFPRPKSASPHGLTRSAPERARLYAQLAMVGDWDALKRMD
jgi:hypothetical protein